MLHPCFISTLYDLLLEYPPLFRGILKGLKYSCHFCTKTWRAGLKLLGAPLFLQLLLRGSTPSVGRADLGVITMEAHVNTRGCALARSRGGELGLYPCVTYPRRGRAEAQQRHPAQWRVGGSSAQRVKEANLESRFPAAVTWQCCCNPKCLNPTRNPQNWPCIQKYMSVMSQRGGTWTHLSGEICRTSEKK